MPHVSDCGHVYCYLCLQEQLQNAADRKSLNSDEGEVDPPLCQACFQPMTSCTPFKA